MILRKYLVLVSHDHPVHYCDVIMGAIASQITSLTIFLPNHSFRRRSKKTSKLGVTGIFLRRIHRWPVNSPYKWIITRKMFLFDDAINDVGARACFLCVVSGARPMLAGQNIVHETFSLIRWNLVHMIWGQEQNTDFLACDYINPSEITRCGRSIPATNGG